MSNVDLHLLEYYREKKANAFKEIKALLEEWAKQTVGIWTTPSITIIPYDIEHKGYEAHFVLYEGQDVIFLELSPYGSCEKEYLPIDIAKLDDDIFWEIVNRLPSVINNYIEKCRKLCTKDKGGS